MAYLLDTNVVSDLVRMPQGRVTDRVRMLGESQVCTSIIVAAELRCGAAKKASARLSAQLEAVLRVLSVLPLEPPPRQRLSCGWDLASRVMLPRPNGAPLGTGQILTAREADLSTSPSAPLTAVLHRGRLPQWWAEH